MQDHEIRFAHRNYSDRLIEYKAIMDRLIAFEERRYDSLYKTIVLAEDISPTAYMMTMLGVEILIDFTISPYSDRTDLYYGKINCYLDRSKDSIFHSFYFDNYGNIHSKHPDDDSSEDVTYNTDKSIITILSKAIIKQL